MVTKIFYVRVFLTTSFFLFSQKISAEEISYLSSAKSPSILSDVSIEVKKQDLIARKSIRGNKLEIHNESPELKELRNFDASLLKAEQDFTKTSKTYARSWQIDPKKAPAWLKELMQMDSPNYVQFHERVVKYLTFYKEDPKGKAIISSWLKKQGRYRDLIDRALEKHNLPSFLLYVAMIESGYDPHDKSEKGAVGLWQIMPEGARIYGLRVDYWVDERKDPVLSTEVAAQYLSDLKKRFGSWHLALAAFNAGYGAVTKSMQKYNTNNYWQLCRYENGLPFETVLYVPKAIATALVGENRALFGYSGIKAEPPLEFEDILVKKSITLEKAARVLGITKEELATLNPHIRRGRVPPLAKGETFVLHIPKIGKNILSLSKKLEDAADSVQFYTVRFGERPEDIAKNFRISLYSLKKENGIEDGAEIREGMTLFLPASAKATSANVQSGEEHTSEEEKTDFVLVAVPNKDIVIPGKKRVFYQVIYGDTLSEIAQFFKVKLQDVAKWNNLDLEATLATKMVLDLWVDKNFDTSQVKLVDPSKVFLVTTGSEAFLEITETLKGRKRIVHKCVKDDTLQKIATKYNFPLSSVERVNGISRKTDLEEGQTIVVYQPMNPEEQKKQLQTLRTHNFPKGVKYYASLEQEEIEEALTPPAFMMVSAASENEKEDEEHKILESVSLFPANSLSPPEEASPSLEQVLGDIGLSAEKKPLVVENQPEKDASPDSPTL